MTWKYILRNFFFRPPNKRGGGKKLNTSPILIYNGIRYKITHTTYKIFGGRGLSKNLFSSHHIAADRLIRFFATDKMYFCDLISYEFYSKFFQPFTVIYICKLQTCNYIDMCYWPVLLYLLVIPYRYYKIIDKPIVPSKNVSIISFVVTRTYARVCVLYAAAVVAAACRRARSPPSSSGRGGGIVVVVVVSVRSLRRSVRSRVCAIFFFFPSVITVSCA